MIHRGIAGCLFLIISVSAQGPALTIKSQHTHDAFQLSLSIAPNQLAYLYS